jgi:hypothetical protein
LLEDCFGIIVQRGTYKRVPLPREKGHIDFVIQALLVQQPFVLQQRT